VRAAWDDPAALDALLDRLLAGGGRRGEAA